MRYILRIVYVLLFFMMITLINLIMTGCAPRVITKVETQEVYLTKPIEIADVDCRYQDANDLDELVNYLLECVINYEAYMRTLKAEVKELEKKQ